MPSNQLLRHQPYPHKVMMNLLGFNVGMEAPMDTVPEGLVEKPKVSFRYNCRIPNGFP